MIRFRIDEQKLSLYKSKSEIPTKYKKILNAEIARIIESFFNDEPIKYLLNAISLSKNITPKKIDEDQIKEYLKPRIDFVKDNINIPILKECNLIRKTTKVGYVQDIEWNISIKKHDLQEGNIGEIPFCTLRFIFKKPSSQEINFEGPMTLDFLFGQYTTSLGKDISCDLHLKDVEDLINNLEFIRDNLKNIEKKDFKNG
jgi:hypothetical protein